MRRTLQSAWRDMPELLVLTAKSVLLAGGALTLFYALGMLR